MTTRSTPAVALHRDVLRLMQARDWRGADLLCRQLAERHPEFAAGWCSASHIALAQGAAATALAAIDRAVEREPANGAFRLQRATCLMALRRRQDALDAAESALRCAAGNPFVLDALGTLYSSLGEQHRALAAYDRAVSLAPQDPRFRYNRASVRRFLGDLEGAEADFDHAIALNPHDFEAYLNRSDLRRQTPSRNHTAALEALAGQSFDGWQGEVQIRYALAKEYEDLERYAESFAQLRRGADKRREFLAYDVANDVATAQWITDAFPVAPLERTAGAIEDSPIFVVGLPRSGTTLVERILGSHSSLTAAGELNGFALALVEAARLRAGRALPRRELVALSATLDFAALGRDYLRRAHDAFGGADRFIDKMPLNYLYCGLIARAVPNAKIIHTTRHPMAAGYAMYKTLFKDGYPFSYDLGDIARYYGAYRRLMDHWNRTMPGAIYEVSYEALVADQPGETRKLLAHCGLEWEDACAQFHRNPAASTTASASQVRRPIYQSSVAQWQHYGAELAPLSEALREFL